MRDVISKQSKMNSKKMNSPLSQISYDDSCRFRLETEHFRLFLRMQSIIQDICRPLKTIPTSMTSESSMLRYSSSAACLDLQQLPSCKSTLLPETVLYLPFFPKHP